SQAMLFALYLVMQFPWQFILVAILVNMLYIPYLPLVNAYLTEISQDRGRVISSIFAGNGAGFFIGSSVFGIVFELTGGFHVLWVSGLALHILATVMFLSIRHRRDETPPHVDAESIIPTISDAHDVGFVPPPDKGSSYFSLITNPLILLVFLAMIAQTLSNSIFAAYFGPYFIDALGGARWLYGFAQGLPTAIGTILVLYIGVKIDVNRNLCRYAILSTFIMQVFSFTGLIFVRDPLLTLMFRATPDYAGLFVGAPVLVAEITDTKDRGKGMTLTNTGRMVGRVMGPALATGIVSYTTVGYGAELPLLRVMPLFFSVALISALFGLMCALIIVAKQRRKRVSCV
ncbi:MAG: MFS transporter, partial [Candidatus Ranarchaeia archaeon]